jgi:hypothetical protein
MVVEDPAGDVEQIADQRVAQRVSHRQSLLLRGHDGLVPQYRQLLRDDRLLERQLVLELLHGAATAHEDFQDPDPGGMSECSKELRLERLEFTGRHRLYGPLRVVAAVLLSYNIQILI